MHRNRRESTPHHCEEFRAMAAEGAQDEDEEIEFPAISPAPVLIALLNLIQALVVWVVAITIQLPRYLLFSKPRRITLTEKEPTGETRRWCRENPGLRGFVLELQTPANTFKACSGWCVKRQARDIKSMRP